jgi:hypothetical protein
MVEIHLELISGVMFGVEVINEDGLVHVVVDLGILRLLVVY